MSQRDLVVVGGGISGLSLAYRILHGSSRAPYKVTVLEATPRVGGVIRTERASGFVLDGGPDSFVATKPAGAALCRELGLASRLIGTRPENRKVYIARGDRVLPMPEGLMLGIPTNLAAMALSPIVGPLAKLRMGLDLVLPRRKDTADESVASFVRRRLGQEALDALAEPLLGGIFAGDCEQLSVQATFPQLVEYEQKGGGLVRGARAQIAARKGAAPKPAGGPTRASLRGSAFFSLLGGLGELVEALEAAILRMGGVIRKGSRAVGVARDGGRYRVRVDGPEGQGVLEADALALATPTYVTAELLRELAPGASEELARVPYVSTATVALGFARADVPHPLDAVGLVLPKRAGKALALTFISSKWEARASDDQALVRVFLGGAANPGALELSDDELVEIARAEVERRLGVRARPSFVRLFRYPRASVQPVVGHLDRVARVRADVASLPGLHLLGPAYEGVGIPDCIALSEKVASRLLA